MPEITMYTKTVCPYCTRAKMLLNSKGVADIQEINIGSDEQARDAMIARSGGRMTVPQIFIGDHHVGGFDDLYALDQKGELDKLLGA